MKLITLLCYLLLVICPLFSQDHYAKGKVINKETNEAIPYANIFIAKKGIGTISNQNGEFLLKGIEGKDLLVCSLLGFEDVKMIAGKIPDMNSVIIKLSPVAYQLPEITILNKTAREIITLAYNNIKNNYSSEYTTIGGIFRKQLHENDQYVFLGEARLNMSYPSYKDFKKKTLAQLEEIKVSENKMISDKLYLNIIPTSILVFYPNFYMFSKMIDDFDWEIGNVILQGNTIVYQINYKGKPVKKDPLNEFNEGSVFISSEDWAFLAIERRSRPDKVYLEKKTIAVETSVFKSNYYFKKINDKYQYFYGIARWDLNLSMNKDSISSHYDFSVIIDFLVQNSEYKKTSYKTNKVNLNKDIFVESLKIQPSDWTDFNTVLPDFYPGRE